MCKACGETVPTIAGIPSFAPEFAGTSKEFDPQIFDRLAARETGHYWFEPRNRLLTGLAKVFFPEARTYLEVGCGTGFVLDAFSRARSWSRIIGSELHLEGLFHARRRLGDMASFVQMDARHIPARRAFDLIGAYDVIEHVEDDEAVLSSVYVSLADRGGIIVAVPQHPLLWSAADDLAHHVRRYRRGELEAKLGRAGFTILHSTSYVVSLLPLMMASRMGRRKDERPVGREFEVPARLNKALRSVLNAEVSLTLRKFVWPVGGSRIVVGRKVERS